ncbi:MAG: amino acid ABC transporter substrate-binding protein [Idiomarina sp.]|nr:amino acid ABC transporter substrate-binding protein [Idiomarina sp.]
MKKMLLLMSCVVLLSACSDSYVEEPSQTYEPSCQLRLGFDAWEPYQYLDVGNVVRGLDVELVQAVASKMDCTITTQQATWTELLDRLQEGEVDMLVGASRTEQREEFARFSDSYRKEQFTLFIRTGELHRFTMHTVEDFVRRGHRLGVVNQYYYGDEVQELYSDEELGPRFVGAMIGELNLARLLDDDIDGFLEDSFVGASMIRRKGMHEYVMPSDIQLPASNVYVMFSRESVDQETVERFNEALHEVRESGLHADIMSRYGL